MKVEEKRKRKNNLLFFFPKISEGEKWPEQRRYLIPLGIINHLKKIGLVADGFPSGSETIFLLGTDQGGFKP